MNWIKNKKKKLTNRIRLRNAIEMIAAELNWLDDCYEDNGLLRFKSRELSNRSIWIPKYFILEKHFVKYV